MTISYEWWWCWQWLPATDAIICSKVALVLSMGVCCRTDGKWMMKILLDDDDDDDNYKYKYKSDENDGKVFVTKVRWWMIIKILIKTVMEMMMIASMDIDVMMEIYNHCHFVSYNYTIKCKIMKWNNNNETKIIPIPSFCPVWTLGWYLSYHISGISEYLFY